MKNAMRSLRWSVVCAFAFFACGMETEEAEPPEYPPCPRYEERVGEECRPVEVLDFEEREFSFSRAGYTLHGTLTLPVTAGEYLPPAFVFAHGSGPNDRDETSDGNLGVYYGQNVPTFRILAERLAKSGAAVYRYDKRSCFRENSDGRCPSSQFSYPGSPDDIMVDDFIADIRAAVRAVAAIEDVRANDVSVVGHSEGANWMPLLLDEPEVVGGVLLGGSSMPIDYTVVEQIVEYAKAIDDGSEEAEKRVAQLREMAEQLETGLAMIRAGTFTGSRLNGRTAAYWKNWMQRTDNLKEEFTRATKPLLVLQGDMDFNVLPSHWERFRSWAEEAEMENATFHLFPNVTHSFVELTPDGRGVVSYFSEGASGAIVEWHRAIEP